LAGARQTPANGFGSHLALRRSTKREDESLEPATRRRVEEVALVLQGVDAGREAKGARGVVGRRPSVVSGGNMAGAEAICDGEQLGKLHPAVARRTRARGLAREVGLYEGTDNLLREERP